MTAENWRDKAACLNTVNLMFGPAGETKPQRSRREAKAIRLCLGCPMLDECRADEDDMPTRWGVRAAENVEQRRNVGRGAPGVRRSTYVAGKRGEVA